MKKSLFTRTLCLALCAAFLGGCGGGGEAENKSVIPTEKIEGSDLYVRKVENIPEDFIMGMDASSVLAQEASGVKYYNFEGQVQDVFT